jgi:hypothetical protein
VIKIDVPPHWTEGSFCGMIFDEDAGDNVTDPLESLMSFGYCKRQYTYASIHTKMALLKSKSLSLLYQYPACPILRSLALYGLRMSASVSDTTLLKVLRCSKMDSYERRLYDEIIEKYQLGEIIARNISIKTRDLVNRKFNIPVDLQLSMERHLDEKNDLSPISFDPILNMCSNDQIHYFQHYSMEIPDITCMPTFSSDKVRSINTWRRQGVPITF